MTKSDALRIFIAAQDDPVLAAWAAVAYQYKVSPLCDISPYEYWEAYQELFHHGLITPAQFDGINARQVFFSGRRPPEQDVLRVLDNLRKLPEPQEPPMSSRTKLPENPFGMNGNNNSLVTRESNTGLANGNRNGDALPARAAAPALNPFSNHRDALPHEVRPNTLPMESFSTRGSLPCRDNDRSLGPSPFSDVQLEIYCCGLQLEMEVADMQAEGPDSIPGGSISVIDRVLHGTCKKCHREHHHSVGEVTQHGIY